MATAATMLKRGIAELFHSVQDALTPQTCVACGEWIASGDGPACSSCQAELASVMRAVYCPRCGRTMAPSAINDGRCSSCRMERFWNVTGVVRVGAYSPAIRGLTLGLKYRGRERNAEFAANLLADAMEQRGWLNDFDCLVPVPMHTLRRWQRPCDHADVLTAALARRVKTPMLRAARRIRHAPSLVNVKSHAQRFETVKGCFAARSGARRTLAGARVCIVDNLLATGATVYEVSKVLRRAGARHICVAVIARTVLGGHQQAARGTYAPSPGEQS